MQEPPTEGSLSSELTYEERTALRFGSTDAAAAENCVEKFDLGEGPWPDMYLTRDCSEIEIGPWTFCEPCSTVSWRRSAITFPKHLALPVRVAVGQWHLQVGLGCLCVSILLKWLSLPPRAHGPWR